MEYYKKFPIYLIKQFSRTKIGLLIRRVMKVIKLLPENIINIKKMMMWY